jgi:hypothetical protein
MDVVYAPGRAEDSLPARIGAIAATGPPAHRHAVAVDGLTRGDRRGASGARWPARAAEGAGWGLLPRQGPQTRKNTVNLYRLDFFNDRILVDAGLG